MEERECAAKQASEVSAGVKAEGCSTSVQEQEDLQVSEEEEALVEVGRALLLGLCASTCLTCSIGWQEEEPQEVAESDESEAEDESEEEDESDSESESEEDELGGAFGVWTGLVSKSRQSVRPINSHKPTGLRDT